MPLAEIIKKFRKCPCDTCEQIHRAHCTCYHHCRRYTKWYAYNWSVIRECFGIKLTPKEEEEQWIYLDTYT